MNLLQKIGLSLLGPEGITEVVSNVNAGKKPRELVGQEELDNLFHAALGRLENREAVQQAAADLADRGTINKGLVDTILARGDLSDKVIRAALVQLLGATDANKLIQTAYLAEDSGETSRMKRRSPVYQEAKAFNLGLTETNTVVELAALLVKRRSL